MNCPNVLRTATALALAFAATSPMAADPDIEQVRAATAKLIGQLIEQGVLARDKGAALIEEVGKPAPVGSAGRDKGNSGAATTVRVPYVPEFVRKEIKDELRTELVAQAVREGWAGPGAVPAWVRGIEFDGDLRLRAQSDRFADANAPQVSITDTNRTRALALANVEQQRNRLRFRGRLGLTVTADENWSGGFRDRKSVV